MENCHSKFGMEFPFQNEIPVLRVYSYEITNNKQLEISFCWNKLRNNLKTYFGNHLTPLMILIQSTNTCLGLR